MQSADGILRLFSIPGKWFFFFFAVVLGFNAWDWPLSLLAISMNPLLLTDSSYQVVENISIKQLDYNLEISMR